jgi:hypothetical protein
MTNEHQPVAELFPARFNGDEIQLLCPVCGFDYVRLVQVYASPAGPARQSATIDAEGVSTGPRGPVGGQGRGNTLTLTFQCGSGHEFSRSFLLHKGQTTLECLASKIADSGGEKPA